MMLMTALVWTVVAQGASIPLSGTVVEEGGDPVVGAELVLIGPPGSDSFRAPPQVVARAKSGEGGRFTLDSPAGLAGDGSRQSSPILWAAKPGFRISATRFLGALPGPDEPLRIVLEPPGHARVRVEDPDGRPVAGAVVLPSRFLGHHANIPDVIAEMAPATTGADGVAVLDALSQDAMSDVQVRTREFGAQVWCIENWSDAPNTVPLRPASTWKGRLTAKDPAHVKGWRVRARTWIRDGSDDRPRTIGRAEAVTDDEGRFTLAPIADGTLHLELEPPGDLPVLPNIPWDLAVVRGREQSRDIPLQKPVVVAGRVLERGTGRAIADARLFLTDVGPVRSQSLETYTDADGRYAFRAFPGKLRVGCAALPESYIEAPGPQVAEVEVVEGAEPVELAPREVLRAAPPLRGEVRDEGGRLVAGADVQIAWRAEVAGISTGDRISMNSDADGGFVVRGLPPDATVTIMASHRGRRTQPPLETRSGVEAPANVVVSPMPLAAAVGRLTAPAGTRLGGIQVRIFFRPGKDAPEGLSSGRFALPMYAAITSTGPDGSYRTPKEIERMPGAFRAEVYDPRFPTTVSEWIPTPDGELLRFPDLALTPGPAPRRKASPAAQD